jgi:hypothetical protein
MHSDDLSHQLANPKNMKKINPFLEFYHLFFYYKVPQCNNSITIFTFFTVNLSYHRITMELPYNVQYGMELPYHTMYGMELPYNVRYGMELPHHKMYGMELPVIILTKGHL